jgi:peroxiredoxin
MSRRGILIQIMIESKPFTQPLKLLPLILVGLGMVLIVVSTFFIFQGTAPQTDFSTVPVKVNYPAPELTLTDTHGISHSLTEYRGQVVLINLWATWCIPCTKEMPALQSFYSEHKDNGLVVIAVNDGEPKADVLQFAKDYDLTFPIWLDPTYIATEKAFKTMNLPSSFVIDRDGAVQWMWVGGISREMLDARIAPLITENP